jgi:hypothetical protein
MTSRCLKTLSTLTVLAGAPLIAQAGMEKINNDDLSAVSGQLSLTFNSTTTVEGSASVPNNPNPLLLPITVPLAILDGFTSGVLDNAGGLGASTANILFAPLFRPLILAGQGVDTALDVLFFPISAPLDIVAGVFDALEESVVGSATAILTAPLNAVFGPVNRYVDGVTGRAQATVDGVAYAVTEVKGALITNAFASASASADANGLGFTSRVFGRVAQAQAGRTAMRLDTLAARNGY